MYIYIYVELYKSIITCVYALHIQIIDHHLFFLGLRTYTLLHVSILPRRSSEAAVVSDVIRSMGERWGYHPYAPWCWYIDLHLGVILFGQMLVNIPYMELFSVMEMEYMWKLYMNIWNIRDSITSMYLFRWGDPFLMSTNPRKQWSFQSCLMTPEGTLGVESAVWINI